MPYIISTLAAGNDYTAYTPVTSGAQPVARTVSVKGGAGVANRNDQFINGKLTPNGVKTFVSDEDLEFLKKNPVFQTHMSNGFIKIVESDAKPDEVVSDMTQRDVSAPLKEEDYEKGGRAEKAGAKPKGGKIQ